MEVKSSRSVVVTKFGGYNVLQVKDAPLPDLAELVEVQVEYGGLNFADLYSRQGLFQNKKVPYVSGIECSGIITAVGDEVIDSELHIGQRVICYNYNGGMFGDIIRVKTSDCFPIPDFIDFKTASASFVNYLTAYFGIKEMGNLQPNDDVLILSCTGGVGIAATQLAKLEPNVKVFGTGSKHKKEDALKNGVDVFFQNETFETEVSQCKFDLILTNQSGKMYSFLLRLLKPLGRIVVIGANQMIKNEKQFTYFNLFKEWFTTQTISLFNIMMHNRVVGGLHLGTLLENDRSKVKAALNNIFNLIEKEKLNPVIDSIWSMEKIVDATKRLGERKNVGKVLVTMGENEDEKQEEETEIKLDEEPKPEQES